MLQKSISLAVGALVLLLGMPVMSHGHASLAGSEPRAGEVLESSPASVKVRFSTVLEPAVSTVSVYDGESRKVDSGNVKVNGQNRKQMEVELPALSPGTYKVLWSIAGRDGHRMKGEFTFSVKGAP